MVICPTCDGCKEYEVYACPGFRRVLIPCSRCKATGRVTEVEAQRVEAGRQMREARVARGLSLRQEADRLGLTPMELADLEHAR